MNKNPFVAFLLGFFPGGGLLYLGKLRGLFYMLVILGFPFSFLVFGLEHFIFFVLVISLLMYVISFIDTIATAAGLTKVNQQKSTTEIQEDSSERFYTIVLSIVPGLGHLQLGLMNRGLTFLTAFFGLGAMILFATVLSGRSGFMMFLLLLPVIWVYSLFDAINQLNKKQGGEELVDESILVDFERRHESGQKSRTIATLLSVFPGVGHLYLGLQKRGIQLLAAFLLSIYILDVLYLGIFLFILPILWFYSFFDGLQKASEMEEGPVEDIPLIDHLMNYQKWIGIGLILIGGYYLTTNVFLPVFDQFIPKRIIHAFESYFQIIVVSLLLIGGGIKLLLGKKEKTT